MRRCSQKSVPVLGVIACSLCMLVLCAASLRGMLKLSSVLRPNVVFNANAKRLLSHHKPLEHLVVEHVGAKKNVGLIKLNRPKALNALFTPLLQEMKASVQKLDADHKIGAIVITGSEKAFAAGADIKEMLNKDFSDLYQSNFFGEFRALYDCKKPIIAAVNGFALGGGCELAMACDIIYAGEKAQFGQPEVYPAEEVVQKAIELGEKIADQSPIIVSMCKEAVNKAYETTLQEGLHFERRLFHSTFATHDRKEGMTAFTEKRKPNWSSK